MNTAIANDDRLEYRDSIDVQHMARYLGIEPDGYVHS